MANIYGEVKELEKPKQVKKTNFMILFCSFSNQGSVIQEKTVKSTELTVTTEFCKEQRELDGENHSLLNKPCVQLALCAKP
jgi:hypothetical protein